ncbi:MULTISPECIES: helix-turn-helix domain-containing protein [Halobacillus]|uniref:helix-turn-helix domain-containing protein n=1 Tax=Halobacillus TaxID=45667 RepID=UPI001591811F|nr:MULTISPECIES: helix-turn-helix transcriptional regulator [Halobacillus]
MRKELGKSQQQLSIDMYQSREYISKQENGERKIPPAATKHFIGKYNDPWLALEAANEYIGWGILQLNGPAADNHRSSVRLKLEEELNEALESIMKVKVAKNPEYVQSMEFQDIRRSAMEVTDVIHASVIYLATVCETYNVSWLQLWEEHHTKLRSKKYVT